MPLSCRESLSLLEHDHVHLGTGSLAGGIPEEPCRFLWAGVRGDTPSKKAQELLPLRLGTYELVRYCDPPLIGTIQVASPNGSLDNLITSVCAFRLAGREITAVPRILLRGATLICGGCDWA